MCKKTVRFLILVILFLSIFPNTYVFASEDVASAVFADYSIPEDFDFTVQDTCSEHDFFFHVSVRDDGWFAVFYRTAVQTVTENEMLSRVYIDIFNADGEFLQEISFESSDDITLELTADSLDMYFYDYMLSYSLSTREVQGFRIPDNYAVESGLSSEFQRKTFEVDGWKYECGRTLIGYTTIKRTKGNTEELLLSLSGNVPGTDLPFVKFIFLATLGGALIIPCLSWKRIQRKLSQRKNIL